jgi:hypothetical protein
MAGLTLLAALALPAGATANSRTLTVPAPAAGNVTVAHVTLPLGKGKLPSKASALLTNAGRIPDGVLVLAGAKKGKKRTMAGSVVVVSQAGASGRSVAKLEFRVPGKGAQFNGKPKVVVGKNLVGQRARHSYCGAMPRRFGHVKRLIGTLVKGFSAAQIAKFGYLLGCAQDFPQRDGFVEAFGGDQGSGGGGDQEGSGDGEEDGGGTRDPDQDVDEGAGDPCADIVDPQEASECEEAQDNPVSATLQGSGSIVDEGGGVFRYEISFNEPVRAYRIEIASGVVRCPTLYGDWKASECEPLGNSQVPDAGGTAMTCGDSTFGDATVNSFECLSKAAAPRTPPPTVPAGTVITGRFTVQAGSPSNVAPATLYGYGAGGRSQPATLSGP